MSENLNLQSAETSQGSAAELAPVSRGLSRPALSRTWGFRFSVVDAVALGAFAGLTLVLHYLAADVWWLVIIVASHFFLFCNVFRLRRSREMIWAGLFVLNAAFWLLAGHLDPVHILACQVPATLALIAWEIRSARYHGIAADRLNPRLNDYLNGTIP